jgi:hypothetical protein
MGEVYRARDPRLGRDVAVKVLPAAFSADPERLHRFEQEARAAAALNHPNILAVYDIGQHDGAPYIVSELLEGETLRERLNGGALPVRKAVEFAVQIAHGLAAAHEKGIVHRDLKPENVFVTSDGRVKILDFGLAKLTQAEPSAAAASALPTTPPNTQAGLVLGTIGYMSPEQVRGLAADHRSDIFAFGAILHEMLSGQRAFRGDTAADTMSAILAKDPPDLPVVDRHISPALERIVDRCLEKSPTVRFQSAGDLAFALEGLSSQSEAAASTPVIARRKGLLGNARVAWTLLATAGLTIGALSIPATLHLRERPVANPEVRLELTTPATRQPLHFAISPDGRHLVFAASGEGGQRLWQRPLDAVTALLLDGTEGAEYPFWSPDSRAIGFFASGKLKRMDIAGGPPQIVADAPNGRGGAWNRDGTILFAPGNASALMRVPTSGGEPQPVTKVDPPRQAGHRLPQFLPDGRRFLFFAQGNSEGQGIYIGSLDSADTKRLTSAEASGAYTEPGVLVFMQQNALVVRSFDLAGGMLTGDPVTIAERVSYDAGFNLAGFSVSAVGRLAYRAGGSERRQLTWFDRTGKMTGVAGEPDTNNLVTNALSPDGRRIVVSRTVQSNVDVWVIDVLRVGRHGSPSILRSTTIRCGRRTGRASPSARAATDFLICFSSRRAARAQKNWYWHRRLPNNPTTGRPTVDSCCISTGTPKPDGILPPCP